MVKNVYIHIPFCKSKCNYCSFVSFNRFDLKEDYIEALKKQIVVEYKGELLNTLYFGGGTPSLLSIEQIKSLVSLFNFDRNTEITFEANPENIDPIYLESLKSIGINRISFGVQSFSDETLSLIGRKHKSQDVFDAISASIEAGFENINIDLIYGLPCQSLSDFEQDLKQAIDLNIQHISLYGLKIEEGCAFYQNKPKNLPNLDLQADMYLKAIEVLTKNSFEHYEISNFSKNGFKSQHNLNYWDNNTYYGFGVSASGYVDEVRYTNEIDLENYIKNPLMKKSEEKLSKQEILEEYIFLGFRKMSGINVHELNKKFEIDFEQKYSKILDKYLKLGHLAKTQAGYALTKEGILLSNNVLSEFIEL